ncbi:hypothetical protein AQUSIP_06670 [Aquicella siphonis]|uniref:DUF4440 domain-containing protein n=1 Tax=Aquicella siphonis TaxID=254247 RepID=A0A5E4PG06_9COXI|nr:hypothetical protein [Aquicella siphonis]VVC75377.1 hypothetical protein AQUSIP_06670 [Aquicella siphonis]
MYIFRLFYLLVISLISVSLTSNGYASKANDKVLFQELFKSWTKTFNQKKYPEVCDLFSKSIVADYQGSQRKNYSKLCFGFKKIFKEKNMVYHNNFKIHKIYHSNNLAAVRITWYLDIYKNGAHVSTIQEEGLDILQKQSNNQWQIVNFIAYPVSQQG